METDVLLVIYYCGFFAYPCIPMGAIRDFPFVTRPGKSVGLKPQGFTVIKEEEAKVFS
jgi:hypothetical protein